MTELRFLGLPALKREGASVSFDDPKIVLELRIREFGYERVLDLMDKGRAYEWRRDKRRLAKERKKQ